METRQLRVLHSLAPSQTYVLARSPSFVPVYLLNDKSKGTAAQFARVSLKKCIDLICDSSSELFDQHTKDYSVYSMDPLESLAPMASSSSSSSSQSVSVACGRVSAIRSSKDQVMVTGTLMKDVAGQEALEVIFVLRATSLPHVHDPATRERISAAMSRQTEQRLRAQYNKELQQERYTPRPKDGADRIIQQSNDQCKVQTGEIRSTKGKEKEKEPESKPFAYRSIPAQGPYPASLSSPAIHSSAQQSFIPPVAPTSLPVPPTTTATPDLAPELLAIVEIAKRDPKVNNQALLNIMSYIDSATRNNANVTIADVLRDLAPGSSTAASPQRPQTPPQTPTALHVPTSPDDDVVVLDKENVNPTAFRRRAERDSEDAKLLAATMEASNTGSSRPQVRLAPGLSQSVRSNTTLSNDSIPPAPVQSATTASTARKRTFSEVLEDTRSSNRRDHGRSSRSNRDRSSSQTRAPPQDPLRHYDRTSRLGEPRSSPPRPFRSNENASPGVSKGRPIVIPDSPSYPSMPASSPIRRSIDGGKSRMRRKPYVLPEWARTGTALQPRLSEEAQQELERRKLEEKSAKRKKALQWRKATSMHRTISTPAVFSTGADEPPAPVPTSAPTSGPEKGSMAAPPPRVAAAAPSLPVFAIAESPVLFPTSALPTPSSPRSPSPKRIPAIPCTPPRRRVSSFGSSPAEEEYSLFTPQGMDTPRRGFPIFDSPSARTSPSSRSFSRSLLQREATPPPSSGPIAEESDGGEESGSDDEDALARELNSAFESASDGADLEPSIDEGADVDEKRDDTNDPTSDNEEGDEGAGKQFWSGLPPSSPPAPSSPMLLPVTDDDDDDTRLPTVSSDFDVDHLEEQEEIANAEQSEDPISSADDSTAAAESMPQLDDATVAALLSFISDPNNQTLNAEPTDSSPQSDHSMDFLKDLGFIYDAPHQDQPTPDGFSFPSDISLDNPDFWNAITPALEQSQSDGTGAEGFDPVQNLLSGCVL